MNIKKFLFIFYIMIFGFYPAYGEEIAPQSEDKSELQQFVFAVDDADEVIEGAVEITQEEEKPFLGDYIELKETACDDDILLNTDFNPKYRVNQIKKVSTYSKSLEMPSGNDMVLGSDKFGITSKSTQYNDSNTLNKNLRQELGATVRGKYLSLTGGVETTYDTTNINPASRGAFITPSIRLGERASISFKNKISGQKLNKYEPMVGIDYTPKYIKNSSIWMGAGATILDNAMQSQSLNLRTNFYVF